MNQIHISAFDANSIYRFVVTGNADREADVRIARTDID